MAKVPLPQNQISFVTVLGASQMHGAQEMGGLWVDEQPFPSVWRLQVALISVDFLGV